MIVYLLAATGTGAEQRLDAERRAAGLDPADDVGVAGDAKAVVAAIGRIADAGADSVVLQPTAYDPDPEAFVRFVAGQVRPLVR